MCAVRHFRRRTEISRFKIIHGYFDCDKQKASENSAHSGKADFSLDFAGGIFAPQRGFAAHNCGIIKDKNSIQLGVADCSGPTCALRPLLAG